MAGMRGMLNVHRSGVRLLQDHMHVGVSQPIGLRDIGPMLDQCWFIVYDTGTTLTQQWKNVSCFLGAYLYKQVCRPTAILILFDV